MTEIRFEAAKLSTEIDVIMYNLVYGDMTKAEAYKALGAISHKLWEFGKGSIEAEIEAEAEANA